MFLVYFYIYHVLSSSGSRSVLNACFYEDEELTTNETCYKYYPTNYSKFDNEYTAIYNQINFKVYGEINHTFTLANIPLTLLLSINGMDSTAQVTLAFPEVSKLRIAIKDIIVTIVTELGANNILNCNTLELDNVTFTNKRSFSIEANNVTTTITSLENISHITSSSSYTLELRDLYIPTTMKIPVETPNVYFNVGSSNAHITKLFNYYIIRHQNSSEYLSIQVIDISSGVNVIVSPEAIVTIESISTNECYQSQSLNVMVSGTVIFPRCSWGDQFKFSAELQRDSTIKLYGYTPVNIITDGNALVLASYGSNTGVESIIHTTTKMITVVMPDASARGSLTIRTLSIQNSIYFQCDYPNMNVRLGLIHFPTDLHYGKLKLSGQALYSIDSIHFNNFASEVDVLKFDASGVLKVYYYMTKETSKIACSQCLNRSKLLIYPIVVSNISVSFLPGFTDISFLSMIFNGAMNSDISFNFSLNTIQFTTESDNNFEVHSIREGIYDMILRTDFIYNKFFISDNNSVKVPLNNKKVTLNNGLLPLIDSQQHMKELSVTFGQLDGNAREISFANIDGPLSAKFSSTVANEDHITIHCNPFYGYSKLILENNFYNFDKTPLLIDVLELHKGARLNAYKLLEIANKIIIDEDMFYTIPKTNYNNILIILKEINSIEIQHDCLKFGSDSIYAQNITIEANNKELFIKSNCTKMDYNLTIVLHSACNLIITGNYPKRPGCVRIISGWYLLTLVLQALEIPFYIEAKILNIDSPKNSKIYFLDEIKSGRISAIDGNKSTYYIKRLSINALNMIGLVNLPNSTIENLILESGFFDFKSRNVNYTKSIGPNIFINGSVGWVQDTNIYLPYTLSVFPIINITTPIMHSINLRMVYKGRKEDSEVQTMIDNKDVLKKGIHFFCGEYIDCSEWNLSLESDSVEYFDKGGAVALDCARDGNQQCVRFRFLDNIVEPPNEGPLIAWVLGSVCVVALLGFLSCFVTHFYKKKRLESNNLIFHPIL